jgi:hypothetical protein
MYVKKPPRVVIYIMVIQDAIGIVGGWLGGRTMETLKKLLIHFLLDSQLSLLLYSKLELTVS